MVNWDATPYEKPHSSKIVFTLFNQEKFAFCVLHKWYIKRYTTEKIKKTSNTNSTKIRVKLVMMKLILAED
jgi:hypothetical protein